MWTLRLATLLSCLVYALGDIEAYSDASFDLVTKTGKHFIQFWHGSCHDCVGMIPTLLDIDTALGAGAEDIWIARALLYTNPELTQRFEITTAPMFVYVVGDKYYKVDPNRSFITDEIVEYLRSGFLSDVAYDIPPPPPAPIVEKRNAVWLPWLSNLLDAVFGEPEIVLIERKAVKTLRTVLLIVLVAIVVLSAVFSSRKFLKKEKKE